MRIYWTVFKLQSYRTNGIVFCYWHMRFAQTILRQQSDYRAHYVSRFRDILWAVQFNNQNTSAIKRFGLLEVYGPVNNEVMSSRSVNSGTVLGEIFFTKVLLIILDLSRCQYPESYFIYTYKNGFRNLMPLQKVNFILVLSKISLFKTRYQSLIQNLITNHQV